MNDQKIEAFLAIAMTRNFQQAAQGLHVTQSTVSHHLKELESELGSRLIERRRGGREVSLTLFGQNFLPLAFRWKQVKEEMELSKKQFYGSSLSVGGLDSVKSHVLVPFFCAFLQKYPKIQLQLSTGSSTALYERVARREIDMAFVQMDLQSSFVKCLPFYQEKLRLMLYGDRTSETVLQATELDPVNELQINWGHGFNQWHDNLWGPLRPARTLCDTLLEMKRLFSEQRFWGIVPESSVQWFLADPMFHACDVNPPPPLRVISFITHREPRFGVASSLTAFRGILYDMSVRKLFPNLQFL